MEFRRALRVLGYRWWAIALAGLVGLALALGAAYLYNDRIEPRYEARAPVNFLRLASETDAQFEGRLGQARSVAFVVLTDGSQNVEADPDNGALTFLVTGDNADAAAADAAQLRDAYLAIGEDEDQFAASYAELARLQTEIDGVRDQIGELRPAPATLDPSVTVEREQLAFEINSLRQTIASLRIQIAYPELTAADPATLVADLARSEALLERLSAGLADLPTAETTSTTETLDMLVMQRHLQDLEARYVSISLSLLEQPDVIGPLDGVQTVDQTSDEIGWWTAGPAGLLAGVLGMVALLLLADRVRRPLWALDDAQPLTPIGVIDRARPGAGLRPWYPRAGQATRRRQVQALRAALDRAVSDGPVSIGLVGVSVPETDVQALAADLGASVAASGHRVLLMDASFTNPSDLVEFGSDLPDLATLIARRESEDAGAAIKQALAERPEVLTDLHALRAGSAGDDAADALAGRQFRMVLGAAAELDELVIVAAPSFGDPGTEVLSQRLDYLVLVCAPRRTARRSYEAAIGDLSDRYATLFGTVLLEGRSPRIRTAPLKKTKGARRATRRQRRKTDEAATDPAPGVPAGDPVEPAEEHIPDAPPTPVGDRAEAPVAGTPPTSSDKIRENMPRPSRAVEASKPAKRRTVPASPIDPTPTQVPVEDASPPEASDSEPAAGDLLEVREPPLQTPVSHPSLRDRLLPSRSTQRQTTRSVAEVSVQTEPAIEVVIDDRDTVRADRAAAERYLIDKVLTLVGAGSAAPEGRLGVVDEEGMVPVTPGAGSPAAATRLERLLFADTGGRTPEIDRGLVDLLGDNRGSLQRWIEQEFFPIHTRLSEGNPAVLHLSSATGVFQALVTATDLDPDHIRLLRRHDVRRTMLGLRRSLADAAGDDRRVKDLTNRINELRAFDRALTELERRDRPPTQQADPVAQLDALRELGILAPIPPPAR